jgi:ankyrin repeat protein
MTPVFIATQHGQLELVTLLASFGADVNIPTNDGTTPLFSAAARGHDRVAAALVSLGAAVDTRRTDAQWTRHLIGEFDLDPAEEGRWTPLMIAARNGHLEVVKVLLKGGASVGAKLSDGRTALSLAAARGHANVAAMLATV